MKPVSYIFTNPDFTKDKTKLFMYDEETHRHVYASYSSYKTYCGETHSALAYQFSYGTSGTLSMWFKLDSGTYTENRYIFSIQKSSTFNEVISCYIGTDNRLYVTSPNNSTYIFNISNPLSWNFISIIWEPNTLMIGLNGNLSSVAINSSINATNSITFIGHKSVYYNITNNHLQGKIQLISYKDDAITDDELFDIEDYGYLIDVRKEYDNDDRLIKRSINTLDNSLNTTYAYFEDVNSNKLNRLPSNEIDYNNIKTIYAYDEDGNIIEKRVLNGNTIKEQYLYEYNELKQLKKETHYRENNQFDYSYEYEYNINGNRTKVTSYDETESILSEDEYTYSNIYKDRLESVNHNNTSLYTFNYQGSNFLNPSSITKNNNTKFLSWHGRKLTSIGSTSFNYNESGIRIRKDNTNDETSYYVNSNNKVLRSNFIDINHNNYIIDYHYDESGSLIGLHFDGKEYFYKKDILGIINEIIDEEGTPYVYYKYTAYGIPASSINTNLSQNKQLIANILLNHNIYIYKDYIYDRDIELYYLNSRYYDPYIGRFISIDAIEYLDFEIVNGLNLYAYCGNNPIMYVDPSGHAFIAALLISMVIAAVIGGATAGYSAYQSGERGLDLAADIVGGAIFGAAVGATIALGGAAGLAATGASVAGFGLSTGAALGISVGATAIAGMTKYSLDCVASNENNWNFGGFVLSGVEGALQGAATFGLAFVGGKSGLFNKLGNFRTWDAFYANHGGMNTLRAVFWGSKVLIGETLSKALFVSGSAALARWLIDLMIPDLY